MYGHLGILSSLVFGFYSPQVLGSNAGILPVFEKAGIILLHKQKAKLPPKKYREKKAMGKHESAEMPHFTHRDQQLSNHYLWCSIVLGCLVPMRRTLLLPLRALIRIKG